ncbi:uncharacterized protein LOC130901334 [Diorhabda carinulata]|uniref:uncharacterized protein LOC130901334 n=1 Tax=Diorhabda carinulata TaxID=1163345 RepID=UPI0025A1D701|nr:uncharacterized protein LOC130901334 [Diorhabda carinulata]
MEFKKRTIYLTIRYLDDSTDNPNTVKKIIEVSPHTDPNNLKTELYKICNISNEKVMKIRNGEGDLVPISFLADPDIPDKYFQLDITNVSYIDRPAASLLQDAYVDAVQQKIRTLESRIAQSELLLPQLEWRRQAYMEDTVNGLLYKVGFLNRRFDELLPQCRPKHTETMA